MPVVVPSQRCDAVALQDAAAAQRIGELARAARRIPVSMTMDLAPDRARDDLGLGMKAIRVFSSDERSSGWFCINPFTRPSSAFLRFEPSTVDCIAVPSLGRGVEHIAELVPMRTGPALQPHLGVVHVDLVRRVDLDAGSTVGRTTFFRLLACLMMFSRDRSSPHCLIRCSSSMPCV